MRPWLTTAESSSESEEETPPVSPSEDLDRSRAANNDTAATMAERQPGGADDDAAATTTPRSSDDVAGGEWIEATDPSSGRIYYYNEITGESRWDRPDSVPADEFDDYVVDDDAPLKDEPLADEPPVEEESPSSLAGAAASPLSDARDLAGPAATSGREEPTEILPSDDDFDEASTEPSARTEESANDPQSLPLLEGWIEALDPSTGRNYYYNQETGASSWDRPVAMTTDDDGGGRGGEGEPAGGGEESHVREERPDELPPEEEKTATTNDEFRATDQDSYDVSSREASFLTVDESDIPDAEEEGEEGEDAGDVDIVATADSSRPSPLPAGWLEATDPSSGKTFYYNQDTGASSWDRPEAPAADAPKDEGAEEEDRAPAEEGAVIATEEDVAEQPAPGSFATASAAEFVAERAAGGPVEGRPAPWESEASVSSGIADGGDQKEPHESEASFVAAGEEEYLVREEEECALAIDTTAKGVRVDDPPEPSDAPARPTADGRRERHALDPALIEPYRYINSVPGKDVRGKLIDCFQLWFDVPDTGILEEIKSIIADLHNASLLIDDIEDNSKLRRGVPVAHHIFGVAPVINAANYVYFLALERCAGLGNEKAMKVFVSEMLNLHRGQGLDIQWREATTCPTESQYISMVTDKTGGLFRLAVGLLQSFATARADVDFVPLVNNLGLYFQIRDDLVNLADEDYFENKSFCEDLTEGKFSFPIIHCISSHNARGEGEQQPSTAATQLLSILKQRTEDADVKRYAQRLMFDAGSLRHTREKCDELKTEILEQIEQLGGNEPLLNVMEMLHVSVRKTAELDDGESFKSARTPVGLKLKSRMNGHLD